MLPANKLSELKSLSTELKDEVQKHHNLDPNNIDDVVNAQLFGLLASILDTIAKIEKNNNTIL